MIFVNYSSVLENSIKFNILVYIFVPKMLGNDTKYLRIMSWNFTCGMYYNT